MNSKFNTDVRTRTVNLQVRDLENGNHEISGYAVVFNQPSEDMGFIEYISPNALDNVDLTQLMLLYGHDFNSILARADSSTLSTKIDDKGLFFVATLPDTTLGNDTYTDIKNGNIKGCSFRFDIADNGDEWQQDDDGTLIHIVNRIEDVPEISLVTLPAYQETSVTIQRSLQQYKKGDNNLKKRDKRDNEEEKEEVENTETEAPEENKEAKQLPDFNGLINQMQQFIDVLAEKEDATRAEEEIEEDNDSADDEIEELPDVTDDTDEDDAEEVRSLNNKKEAKVKTIKSTTINNDKEAQLRGFADYVKSHGSVRDNITTNVEGQVLVPKQVLDPQKVPEDANVLTGLVNRVAVSSPAGSLPVIQRGNARFATKEELAKNPELAKMGIAEVDYRLATYVGSIPISNEMLSDYEQINGIVAQYLSDMRGLTEQDKIGTQLATATAVAATDADGIKDAVNIGLSNYANKTFVITESGYAFIDKLKDGNGRYLFEDSISAASGKSLLGYPVVTVPDNVLGGGAKAFFGDVKSFVLEAYKDESAIKWVDNDIYGTKLASYIRADFKVADQNAGKLITLSAPAGKAAK
ncbi:phage major capsid protein [Lactobacillus sp. ESL0225]|uniref:phage major capsid protein n=1 Tax=Lactobacillus sp. ESL0225 TaxID=2069351 RepID=UPI000EFBB5A0|nr:phage major capsid protein [Lactobacillus sp. ESL0225]RMC47718.1 phage major capsid protein [Lactobacillus sp. ESL0225]